MQSPEARAPVDTSRTRILVIDDDPTTVELVCSVLDSNGFTSLRASSGEEALAIVRATPGILIAISDINMPGMDGIALLGNLTSSPAPHASPRVIFLTAYPSVDFAVAALRLGAVDFLTKPVRPQSLLRSVRSAVERVQRERAMAQPDRAALAEQAEALAAALRGWAQSPRPEGTEMTAPASGAPPAETRSAPGAAGELALLGMDHLRRLRRLFPPLGELDEVAWDLMRELLRAERNGQRLSVSALTVSVEQVSATTALRRTQELVKAGHIVRIPDPSDARRDFVTLAPEIRATLDRYLERVAAELTAAAAGSSR